MPDVARGIETKCTGPFEDHSHSHGAPDTFVRQNEPPLGPSPHGVGDGLRSEVVRLTQELVRINSGPDNLVAGENAVIDRMAAYASEAGLEVERTETVNGKAVLVVSLPGKSAESVGFVHHSDVVQPEGQWKMGEPFSGAIVNDEAGRESIVGRGTVDTKGPAVQVLVALKHLKQQGFQPERSLKLFMFPDEEFGGKDGAHHVSRKLPSLIQDVRYWVVEGSGIMSPEFVGGILGAKDVPYLAVAQKYTIPMQLSLKEPCSPDQAVRKTQAALDRADEFIEKRDWTYLGSKAESKEAMRRMGRAVGGFKGFLIKHFWNTGFMRKRMGKGNAAANRTDFCKTDFFLSNNAAGKTQGPNVKPSSATMILKTDQDLARLRESAGPDFQVEPVVPGVVRLTLPQENYHGGNHGSTADRDQDAVDVTNRAMKRLGPVEVLDVFTSKSAHEASLDPGAPVTSRVTLDLRVAVDENPREIVRELGNVVGSDFELKPLMGPEEWGAKVRRLSSRSPLFQAAEAATRNVYGQDTPVLFGNTTASNDTRFLMEANPNSETLTFVPVLYTRHGAHGPDEAVTTRSLQQGVDWVVDLMKRLA